MLEGEVTEEVDPADRSAWARMRARKKNVSSQRLLKALFQALTPDDSQCWESEEKLKFAEAVESKARKSPKKLRNLQAEEILVEIWSAFNYHMFDWKIHWTRSYAENPLKVWILLMFDFSLWASSLNLEGCWPNSSAVLRKTECQGLEALGSRKLRECNGFL